MNPLHWLAIWFRPAAPTPNLLREALDQGRRLKFAEDAPGSLAAFEQARTLLDPADASARTAVDLHRLEVLLDAHRFTEAGELLDTADAAATTPPQRAYLMNGRGMLRQALGDIDGARTAYEQARTLAKNALLVGAEGRAACHLGDAVLMDGNAAYAVHLLREHLPRLHTAGDLEWTCHFVGVYGQALIAAGQTAEGLDMLRNALSLSEGIGYRAYIRRWSVALADCATAEGRYHDAEMHLDRALSHFPAAPDTPPDTPPDPAALPAYLLPEYVGTLTAAARGRLYLRDHAHAIALAERAVSAAERTADADLIATARGMLGIALRMADRPLEALPHLQAAAATGTVEVLRALAAAQLAADQPEAAAETYAQALTLAADSPLEQAQTLRDRGLAAFQTGRYADAIDAWTRALPLFDDLKAKSQIARLYTDLGNARRALGQSARAMRDYEAALMQLNTLDEFDTETRGVVMANAAVASAEAGDADSADSFFSEAIAIAERSGDQTGEAVRLGNYGWFLLTIGKPRRAIASLERGLTLCETLTLAPHFAVQTDNLALAHDALSDYPRALELHRLALTRLDAAAYPYWEAVIGVNTAHTLIALGDPVSAAPLLTAALPVTRRDPAAAELLVRLLCGQALIALHHGDPAGVDAALSDAIALARRLDLRRGLAEALAIRSRQQAAAGEASAAATAWEEAARLYGRLHMPQAKQQPVWLAG